jgi:hypothetical protein
LCGPLQVLWLLKVTVGVSSTPLVQLVWLLLTLVFARHRGKGRRTDAAASLCIPAVCWQQ